MKRPISYLLRKSVGTIHHIETKQKVLSLTFDDGPSPVETPELLNILRKYNAKATFFLLGEQAEKYPEILKQIAADGHDIGNHTWNHQSLPLLSRKLRREQILKCKNVIREYDSKLMRPPYGHQTLASHLHVTALGYSVVGWNASAYDWLDKDSEFLTAKLELATKPGNIIVLHDNLYSANDKKAFSRKPLLRALENLLQRYSDSFKFLTVTQLMKCGRTVRRNHYLNPDPKYLNSLIPRELK